MSHHHRLRKEATCLNCGQEVTDRYCAHCGQENIEPRQPFHYLFGHFMEDLTHYDHGFWQTFKALMVRPGKLIKNYLAGKRAAQVPPVKLYIFVSFVAFFLPAILPEHHSEKGEKVVSGIDKNESRKNAIAILEQAKNISSLNAEDRNKIQYKIDSLKNIAIPGQNKNILDSSTTSLKNTAVPNDSGDNDEDDWGLIGINEDSIKTVAQLDSLYAAPASRRKSNFINIIMYQIQRKKLELKEKGLSQTEIREKFIESFNHSLPKLLFFYLPVFAFLLWLCNSKKKWLYFDHGIFTLYYFSFLLTCIILGRIVSWLGGFVHIQAIRGTIGLVEAFLLIYSFLYFFLAQYRVYGGSKAISVMKGLMLFFANMILMLFFLIGYLVVIGYLLH